MPTGANHRLGTSCNSLRSMTSCTQKLIAMAMAAFVLSSSWASHLSACCCGPAVGSEPRSARQSENCCQPGNITRSSTRCTRRCSGLRKEGTPLQCPCSGQCSDSPQQPRAVLCAESPNKRPWLALTLETGHLCVPAPRLPRTVAKSAVAHTVHAAYSAPLRCAWLSRFLL